MLRPALVWTALVALAGCAGTPPPRTAAAVRAELPALEARAAAAPSDPVALRELGGAYALLGDYDRAADALRDAERRAPRDPGTAYVLGLVDEAQGRTARALARYRSVGGAGPFGPLAAGRRAWLEREAARAEVDSLLDAERYPPVLAGVVAVFPLRYEGDAALRPLARAATALLADDLAALGVRTVDGERVRAVLDALALAPDDVGADRAARLARVLQSGRAVVGRLAVRGDSARAEAALWDWDESPAPTYVGAGGPVDALLRVEADLVRALAAQAGVALSEADRSRLDGRRVDADALVQYGRGLGEEDAGRFAEAAAFYDAAVRLDPAFRPAADRAAAARRLAAAAGPVPTALAAAQRAAPSAASSRLVGRRLAAVGASLGVHTATAGERDPTAEVPLTPPTEPLPAPPPPPTRTGSLR